MKSLPSAIIAVCLLGANPVLQAQDTATPTPTAVAEPTPKPQPAPFRGTVSAVDTEAGTFSIQNKDKTETKVYSVSRKTDLHKAGNPITLGDIKVGDYVRGIRVKTGEWTYHVDSLKLGPKTEEEIAADQKKKEKAAMNKVPAIDSRPTATP